MNDPTAEPRRCWCGAFTTKCMVARRIGRMCTRNPAHDLDNPAPVIQSGRTYSFARTVTAGELRAFLAGVPDGATVRVNKDQPSNPTPLDPGGTVTLTATWTEQP